MADPTLRVSEIFYSLQGEGARVGEPSIFIRLQGCSAKYGCLSSGVVCDTEFESGKEMSLQDIFEYITSDSIVGKYLDPGERPWIVFTGGEPLDQLNENILNFFRHREYKQALETSGVKKLTRELAVLIDHITVSPKAAEHILEKHFGHLNRGYLQGDDIRTVVNIDELRYVRHAGQPGIPQPSIKAKYYYLSPHSDGQEINQENLQHCIRLCLENPMWRLSVQFHKLWKLL